MITDRCEATGRGVWVGMLFVSWCASCGSSQEPAPPTRAQASAPAPSAPAEVASQERTPAIPAASAAPAATPSVEQRAVPPAPEKPAPKASAPKPPQIELGELLLQRDLWPKKVTLTQPLTIAPGAIGSSQSSGEVS